MWDFQQRGGEFRRSGFGHTEQHYIVFTSKPLRKCHEKPENELDKI